MNMLALSYFLPFFLFFFVLVLLSAPVFTSSIACWWLVPLLAAGG
jgi:hypothetical protein